MQNFDELPSFGKALNGGCWSLFHLDEAWKGSSGFVWNWLEICGILALTYLDVYSDWLVGVLLYWWQHIHSPYQEIFVVNDEGFSGFISLAGCKIACLDNRRLAGMHIRSLKCLWRIIRESPSHLTKDGAVRQVGFDRSSAWSWASSIARVS